MIACDDELEHPRDRTVREDRVRHEALLLHRMGVEDLRLPSAVAVGGSWRQPGPGVAGDGGSSLDEVGSAEHCRMGRAR